MIASALSACRTCATGRSSSSRRPTRRTSKFDDEKSEFIGYLKLWKWLDEGRGGGTASTSCRTASTSSCCATTSSSPRRVREWRDIHSQLHTVVAEHGWRLNGTPATYEQLHLAMLPACSATSA